MPAGPAALGFAYFAAAKLAGYTLFCRFAVEPKVLSVGEDRPAPPAWVAGAVRTLIGVGIGAIVGVGFWKIPWFEKHSSWGLVLFFVFLVPVRVFEWWLLLRWFYPRHSIDRGQYAGLIAGGIVTSFALDALGVVAAWVLPGGMWVC